MYNPYSMMFPSYPGMGGLGGGMMNNSGMYGGTSGMSPSGYADPNVINGSMTTYVDANKTFGSMPYQNQHGVEQNNSMNGNGSMLTPMYGRPVSGLDEVKAFMVPMDGNDYFFTDFANGKIYTKSFGLDGRSIVKVFNQEGFTPASTAAPTGNSTATTVPTVSLEEFNKVKEELNSLKANFESFLTLMTGGTGGSNSAGASQQGNGFQEEVKK